MAVAKVYLDRPQRLAGGKIAGIPTLFLYGSVRASHVQLALEIT